MPVRPRAAAAFFVLAAASRAAILRGTVVENQTGRPLARTLVTVQALAGSAGGAVSKRTGLYGAFVFDDLPAGAFVVSASRKGFASIQYGQKQWKSSGLPVILEENQHLDIEIRLPRLGAIAGSVIDENGVGLPDHEVVAYRAAKPPQLAGRAATDDRGAYRISGLEPGSYFVRTVTKLYEEGGYLPTFFHDVAEAAQATPLDLTLDQQADDISIRPMPGRLFKLAGAASCPQMPDSAMTLTLVSDMGKEAVNADPATGKFEFNPQAPGKYELNLFGTGRAFPCYGYLELELDRDLADAHISGTQMPRLRAMLEDSRGGRLDPRQIRISARRKELSGPGAPQTIDASDLSRLAPGRWEFAIEPAPAYYAAGFLANGNPIPGRADGWNEDMIVSSVAINTIKFVLSNSPGSVHGTVTLGSQQAAGAPVFLENSGIDPARRYKEPWMTRADTRGQYQFSGLAPGEYRLLASFEYRTPGDGEFDSAGAVKIKIEEARDVQQDLTLYVAR